MFTGIIEGLGSVEKIITQGDNLTFYVKSTLAKELKVDQSLSHNGVCLTVEEVFSDSYRVTAIKETLDKSNLSLLQEGNLVNLERSLSYNGRLDGHIVQGHVDCIANLKEVIDEKGSWRLRFEYLPSPGFVTVEKGSVCVNGISLTVVNSRISGFEVAIIPYTWENTNLHTLEAGGVVNIEFDILGKYVSRYLDLFKDSLGMK
jgi:riboflavin synthase